MDFEQRLSLLRERYEASLPSKRAALEVAWTAFEAAPGHAEARAELRTLLHRLAGSAPAYGHKALGEAAATACARLGARAVEHDPREGNLAHALAPLVRSVLHQFDGLVHDALRASEARARSARPTLRLLLLEDDDEQAAAIEAALVAHGCAIRRVAQVEALWETITTWPCDALLIDYWLGSETAESIVHLLRSEPSFAATALVCLTVETDAARLRGMLERGCDRVLSKREPAQSIVDAVESAMAARRAR